MSLALRSGAAGDEKGFFIYFDAVTSYSQAYSGSVTKHPIDAGASIVDHFVSDNPVLTISGVVTGVDVSTGSFNIGKESGESPQNVQEAPSAVSVAGGNDSIISKFIPSSVGQFLPRNDPEVVMDGARASVVEQVQDALIDLVSGVSVNDATGKEEPNIQLVELYEYKGSTLTAVTPSLVVTNVTFSESVDSGDGLYFDITLEKVKFVGLRKEAIPSEYTQEMAAEAATKESKGKQDSTEKDPEVPDENRSRLSEAIRASTGIFPLGSGG